MKKRSKKTARKLPRPLLRAFSGLCIGLSANFFSVVFIGPGITFPKTALEQGNGKL